MQQFASDGQPLAAWKIAHTGPYGGPGYPLGLTVDAAGYVYVADANDDTVKRCLEMARLSRNGEEAVGAQAIFASRVGSPWIPPGMSTLRILAITASRSLLQTADR